MPGGRVRRVGGSNWLLWGVEDFLALRAAGYKHWGLKRGGGVINALHLEVLSC